MGAWKQLLTEDVIVTPFEVNKGFSFPHAEFTNANVQINRLLAVSASWTENQNTTGEAGGGSGTEYQVLVYNSIKTLYYSNFLSSSRGDIPASQSLLPGEDVEGDVFFGPSTSTGRYENYLQTTLTQSRSFPSTLTTASVISIPSRLYGDYILPTSFRYQATVGTSFTAYDDGNGNLLALAASGSIIKDEKVGDIIYPQGIAIFTNPDLALKGIAQANVANVAFSSSYTMYESQWKATIEESEFNFSQNPSIISGSAGGDELYGFTTGSYFQPYVTTVGLYDNNQELLAIGKLSQPYPLSRTTDTTFYINIDR
tara:strand:- start:4228 stop:5166 length:939 start_codon:yes stop_codon:yes gene_type:complete